MLKNNARIHYVTKSNISIPLRRVVISAEDTEVRWKLTGESGFQSLLDVVNKILGLFNTNRQPDQIVTNAKELPLRGRDAPVSHLGRQLGETLHATEGLSEGKQPDRGQELVGFLGTSSDPERDHPAVRETGVFGTRVVLPVFLNEFERVGGKGVVRQRGLWV